MSHRRIIPQPELFRCDIVVFLKILNHMTAIREAGFLTDIIQVKIGEKKEVLYLKNPEPFNICLTTYSIDGLKFFRKTGIAHPAFLGKLIYLKAVFDMKVNVFGNTVDIIGCILMEQVIFY